MKEKIKSLLPPKEENVDFPERVISFLSGSFLMYSALKYGKRGRGLAGGYLMFRGATGYCPTYQAVGKTSKVKTKNINAKTSLTVNKPIEEVYAFWRKLENLPLFMQHLESVTVLDDKTSEWKAKVPKIPGYLHWRSEIVEDHTNERIGWRSLPGSDIRNAGNVHFRKAGKFGTEVFVVISYHAPAGKLGEGLGRGFNHLLEEIVKEDVKNFRRYIETGELPTIEGQPNGKNLAY